MEQDMFRPRTPAEQESIDENAEDSGGRRTCERVDARQLSADDFIRRYVMRSRPALGGLCEAGRAEIAASHLAAQ